jgi:hypothetical protein
MSYSTLKPSIASRILTPTGVRKLRIFRIEIQNSLSSSTGTEGTARPFFPSRNLGEASLHHLPEF